MSEGTRILVVEDDTPTRLAMRRILSGSGFATDAVGTLAEAHAALDGHTLVILDMNLPDGLGSDILRRIRRDGHAIRVAVVSADDDQINNSLPLHPDAVFRKPVDVRLLMTWIREPTLQ